MSIDLLIAYADTAVATNGTLTFTYPAGRTADSYAQTTGAVLGVPTLQANFTQGTSFSLSYGTTTVTLTYLGTTSIPAASGVALTLQLPLQDISIPVLGGAASQPNTDPPVPVPVAGASGSSTSPPPAINPPQLDIVDFGAFPGTDAVSLVITGQTNIVATSKVNAWIAPVATADHSADEHVMDAPRVMADTVVPSVGFTIYASSQSQNRDAATYGKWSVYWQWN